MGRSCGRAAWAGRAGRAVGRARRAGRARGSGGRVGVGRVGRADGRAAALPLASLIVGWENTLFFCGFEVEWIGALHRERDFDADAEHLMLRSQLWSRFVSEGYVFSKTTFKSKD